MKNLINSIRASFIQLLEFAKIHGYNMVIGIWQILNDIFIWLLFIIVVIITWTVKFALVVMLEHGIRTIHTYIA